MKTGVNSVSANGNVSTIRETVNNNISRYEYLGQAKRFSWSAKRSYRSI